MKGPPDKEIAPMCRRLSWIERDMKREGKLSGGNFPVIGFPHSHSVRAIRRNKSGGLFSPSIEATVVKQVF